MRQRRFTGDRNGPSADKPSCGDRVVRGSERSLIGQRAIVPKPSDALNARHLQCLLTAERWQDARQAAGDHRLAGPRRPTQQQVVATGSRYRQRINHSPVASHVSEISEIAAD